jgi:hypothetical protein
LENANEEACDEGERCDVVSGWLDAVGTVVNPLGKVAERPEANGLFDVGDTVLNHGGQVALDVAGLIPGVGEVASAAQAEYHLLHASNDFARGDNEQAMAQTTEAAWNTLNAIPVAHQALEGVHIGELATDSMLTLGNYATGANSPMSAGIVSEGAAELAGKQAEMFQGQYD